MSIRNKVHLALRHDSVLGRQNTIIHANVTQIDLHDFCRLVATYALGGFHAVTEIGAQHEICQNILDFWNEGYGKDYNPDRVVALQKMRIHKDFQQLVTELTELDGEAPLLVGTSAKPFEDSKKVLDFSAFSDIIARSDRSVVIQFGTSWGLSTEQLDRCDWVLPPIYGYDGYNHLSVRCAAAIIVDRLFSNL